MTNRNVICMRVISGKYRRIILNGYDIDGIRPTMDKVKESIFAMIGPYLNDSVCLDLFSGTGSIGIEALSNGCKHVYFIDSMKSAINITKANAEKLKCNASSTIILSDYTKALKDFNKKNYKFDIIFVDPPYGKIKIKSVLDKILEYNVLNDNGIIVCEYEDEKLEDTYLSLNLIKYRKYGKTYISIYKNMR